jgi:hypothetical protein
MLRQAMRGVAVLVLVAAVLDATGRGQQPGGGRDRIYYRDKKDGVTRSVEGELKAVPQGFQVIAANDKKVAATVTIPDLVRVVPGDFPGYDLKTVLDPVNAEEKGNWEAARKTHDAMLEKTKNAPEKVRTYLEFRQAISAAHAADAAADDAVAQAKGGEAVTLLNTFLTTHKAGWEVWPVGQACARLQLSATEKEKGKDGEKEKEADKDVERKQFEAAARTWGKVARAADLPADLRLEATLQEIDLLIRARRYADAVGLIADAAKAAPAGPVRERLAIYDIAAKSESAPLDGVAKIEAAVAKTKDPVIRATGFGMAGELYLAADRPREAMWQFLWVEVVYNQDKDAVVTALVRLSDAFRLQGDEERAKAYREKLRRVRGAL